MRRKRLMTAVLCATLSAASCGIGEISDKSIVYTAKAQTDRYDFSTSLTVSDRKPLTSLSKSRFDTELSILSSETEQLTQFNETIPDTEQPIVPSGIEADTEQPTVPNGTEADTEQPTVPDETEADTERPTVPSETEADTGQPIVPSETEVDTEQPTVPSETDTDTEQPTVPGETVPDTEQPELPNAPIEPDTEFAGETGMTDEGESELLTETKKEQDLEKDGKESESETEKESEKERRGSNEELIRNQNIVKPDDIVLEFRFTQAAPEYAIVQLKEGVSVYESRSEDARVIGKLSYYGICSILEEAEDGWYYIESGSVRGFAKAGAFVTDEVADRIVRVKGLENLPLASRLVSCMSNKAYAYTHTTTQEVLAEKVYAIARTDTKIYEARKTDADVVGSLTEGALCYILADSEKDWIFVESGDARGFVQKEALLKGKKAKKIVQETGEEKMQLAEVKIRPEDNRACYYTLTSVKKASVSAKLREDIVNFALDYLGNPYVWGGTSLTNGADCSGFVQSVYANFGYYLPRVAEAQSVYGMQIPIESAAPGDLIFYARDGYVYHVSMYIGNGQVVHAAGRKVGIITSGITGNAVWATRIILEE